MEITQKQKIVELKETIRFLYEKEGRSKSYISRLLVVDRKLLTYQIKDWGFIQANTKRLSPSNQKFANKNKQLIKSRLDNNVAESQIARELGVSAEYLSNIISKTDVLKKAKDDYHNRLRKKHEEFVIKMTSQSKLNYNFEKIDGEVWKEILGYGGYYISNMGRVKAYAKRYDRFYLLSINKNCRNNRLYVKINNKGLQIARLVGFAFVDGYSEENNTIDHIDGDVTNNKADNLQWKSQKDNNKLAYDRGRSKVVAYQKRGKFKKIILNDKYEFKTIEALSKFLGVSWTQTSRFLDGKCNFDGKLEIVY